MGKISSGNQEINKWVGHFFNRRPFESQIIFFIHVWMKKIYSTPQCRNEKLGVGVRTRHEVSRLGSVIYDAKHEYDSTK